MAKKTIDFSVLVPERDTYTDQNGQAYDFRMRADFSARHLARSRKLQQQMGKLLEEFDAKPDNEETAGQLDDATTEFIQLILPELPDERARALTLGQKSLLVKWWSRQQTDKDEKPEGEAKAGQPS